jgi:phospholipid/cholesterol/gamma-HCH transport system substrate-binding protein
VKLWSNSIKVAVTVLGAILIAFVGYRFMKDIPIFGPGKVISAVFVESKGLAPGRAVSFKGVQIGTIRTVSLLPSDSVLIEMNIDKSVEITEGSTAYIRSADLLGTMVIEILKGESNTPLPNNARIQGNIEGDTFGELADLGKEIGGKAVVTVETMNQILGKVDSMINAQMQKDLQNIASNLEKSTRLLNSMLVQNQGALAAVMSNMEQVTATIDSITTENRDGVSRIVSNLDTTTKSMDELTRELSKTSAELTAMLDKINRGEGTLGKMASDPSLYNNLDSLSANLATLIKNLDENPRKYLRKMISIF